MRFHTHARRHRAFTLVEVLIVVVIIGIAGAIVVPHILQAGTLGVQAATRMLIADMLIAQNEAIAQQETRKVIFDVAANSYRITDANDVTISATWISGGAGNYAVDFNNDSRFTGVMLQNVDFGGVQELVFDPLGAPQAGGTVELVFQNSRYRVTVGAFTGKVTVQDLGG